MCEKAEVYDRVVFVNNFACFGNGKYRGGGQYCTDPKERAAAIRALQLLLANGGSIRHHEYAYWMSGKFGSQFVANPVDLAKTLGFL
ncbi:MAG TPA: hypothetical protein VJH94_02255 [Candidatus Paceibacterota bacterium]